MCRFPFIQALLILSCALSGAKERPNILWITSEDNGPYLGCYGDTVARTPHLDALAKESTRYLNCFSNAAVCAPARQTLITGMYATSIGGQHMRSRAVYPDYVSFFPKYLRDAGYYTTNNSKTDYNGGPRNADEAMKAAWDESSNRAHWRNRPDTTTPFFSVFNITDSHESNLFPNRWKNRELKTDPESVNLPAHLPDLPEIRLDLARYYDCLEKMDGKVGAILGDLEKDGLAKNTIVFYFADHGGSMPRGKSFTYDSGTQVPLLIRTPEKWKSLRPGAPGGVSDRLVSFVDFAPTLLSLAGTEIPGYMQGQPFLGLAATSVRQFVHTFRGRRGERYDIVRGVRGDEFLYLRNYTPHLPVMQFNAYSFAIPGYGAWKAACESGKVNEAQSQWFQPKAAEELYRVTDDPDNVKNLAGDPAFSEVLRKFRSENDRHIREIRDSVFLPEGMEGREFAAYQDDASYPLDELMELGNATSERDPANLEKFRAALKSENACLRFQGVMGCVVLGEEAAEAKEDLIERLEDSSPLIRIQAARALAGMGAKSEALPTIRHFTGNATTPELALRAVLAIDECDLLESDPGLRDLLRNAKGSYTRRVVDKLISGVANP